MEEEKRPINFNLFNMGQLQQITSTINKAHESKFTNKLPLFLEISFIATILIAFFLSFEQNTNKFVSDEKQNMYTTT